MGNILRVSNSMESILKSVDRLLSLLPFNGAKTYIGLAIPYVLPALLAKFPEIVLVAPILDGLSQILVATGVTHKAVKSAQDAVSKRRNGK